MNGSNSRATVQGDFELSSGSDRKGNDSFGKVWAYHAQSLASWRGREVHLSQNRRLQLRSDLNQQKLVSGRCLAPVLVHTHLLMPVSSPATKAGAVMRETFCICTAHRVTCHCPWLLSLGKVAKCTKELKFLLCSL